MVKKACIQLRAPPAMIAANNPSTGLFVWCDTEKPVSAPTNIKPSNPRLITPPFSATISPNVANNKGVPDFIEAMIVFKTRIIFTFLHNSNYTANFVSEG
jgi:hypothetical protein